AVEGSMESLAIGGDVSVAGAAIPLSITRVRVDVQASGGPDSLRARIDATGRAGDREVLGLIARGRYRTAGRVLTVDTLAARLLETGGRVALSGVADLDDPERRLDLRARWSELTWPLDTARYRSDEGRLDVRSVGGRVVASAALQLGGETLPAGRWQVAGQGDRRRFVVDSVRARVLDGELRAAGVVWPDSGAWELEITGDSLAPEQWRPDAHDWVGRVGFRVRTAGAVGEDGPRYRATVDTVRGTLRDRRLGGYAAVEGAGDRVRIDTLRLRAGEAALDAAGTIADTVAVGWRVDARDLGDVMPGAVGRLEARGRVTGPRAEPSIDLTADARDLAVGDWSVDTLSARAEVPDAGRGRSAVELVLRNVRSPSLALDSVALGAAGTRSDHGITLGVGGPDDVMEARLAGGLADGRWTGDVTRLRLRSRAAGEWRLREPVAVAIAPDRGSVGQLCWVGSGELCAAGDWDEDGIRWDASGDRLPMEFFAPVLPRTVAVRGEFGLESRGHSAPGVVPTGELRITSVGGEVDYVPDVGQIVTQGYDSVTADAVSDSSGIDARLAVRLGGPGRLTAAATLPGTAPLADRSITARLDLHLEDEGTVSRYLPAVAQSRGTADARIRVSGRVREPDVEGRLELTGVAADIVAAGVRLREGRLAARSTPDGDWEVEGGVLSDTSRLAVTGSARPPAGDRDWRVQLRLSGTAVPVYDTPELLLVASPDVGVRASSDSITVDGRIAVPRARIAIQQLEGNVEASPDVVIVGADGEAADTAVTPAAVRGEVLLVLGDRVMLDALGLTGRL
ncbi:MAG: translocation/assembly module TamB domain-containing protein, partial [Longimicrobiales bacterium]|nr:translocation/assembly module TamB domain-containing protein [Longimicrobiales bacterium]